VAKALDYVEKEKTCRRGASFWKSLKSGPLSRMHFGHSGTKIRVFELNTDIIKFWLFYSVTAQEYSVQTGGNFQRKVGGEFT